MSSTDRDKRLLGSTVALHLKQPLIHFEISSGRWKTIFCSYN